MAVNTCTSKLHDFSNFPCIIAHTTEFLKTSTQRKPVNFKDLAKPLQIGPFSEAS